MLFHMFFLPFIFIELAHLCCCNVVNVSIGGQFLYFYFHPYHQFSDFEIYRKRTKQKDILQNYEIQPHSLDCKLN